VLSREQPSLPQRPRQLVDGSGVVPVIAVPVAGQAASQDVMEIVGPDTVEPPAAVLRRIDEGCEVAVILGMDRHRPRCRRAYRGRDSATMCAGAASASACVASIRSPSRRYSVIHDTALSTMKRRTASEPAHPG
jgi:hypothetical protein